MCKGVAVLVSKDKVLIGADSSHERIESDTDGHVKVNVIYDDTRKEGFRVEVDDTTDVVVKANNIRTGLCGKDGKLKKSEEARLIKRLSGESGCVFRVLCRNMQSAEIKGNQYNSAAEIEGNQDNGYAKIEGNQDNGYAEIKGNQDNGYAEIKGNQYNNSAEIEGNQDNGYAEIKGNQDNNSAEIKGNQDNGYAKIEGKIIIYNLKNGGKEAQAVLDEFSKKYEHNPSEASLENLILYLTKKGGG